VVAAGGQAIVPDTLQGLKEVAHSSQFANIIPQIQQRKPERPLRFAVIGNGQSAAEIFHDLWSRFPDANVKLIIRGSSLRPSDDSPFVNEIFDPDRVDGIYNQPPSDRAAAIALNRGTNYGVVRLELLEELYEKLYMQRVHNDDESQWRCRIIHNRAVVSASQTAGSGVELRLAVLGEGKEVLLDQEEERLEVDYVFAATGYVRNSHESILRETRVLLPADGAAKGSFPVGRDYRVKYDPEKVDERRAGVWLQGCNERTHGLSDTLLSILAIRGGELVQSIFGKELDGVGN